MPSDHERLSSAQFHATTILSVRRHGVVAIGGRMYDRPHLRAAQRLLARAASI